jgi:hypothetical protein
MDRGGLQKLSVFLSLWEHCNGNLDGGLLYWGLWRICKGRLWRRASLSIGVPLGNLERGSCTGDAERWIKEGSGNGVSLSLWELYEGNLEEGSPLLGTRTISQVRLLKWASVSIGSPVAGEHGDTLLSLRPSTEGSSLIFIGRKFIETFDRHVKESCGTTLSIGAPVGDTGRGSFTGTFLRDRWRRALETGNSLHWCPRWGNWTGFVYRDFFERQMESSGNGQISPWVPPLGNLDGVR